ncbi:dihydrofolate reductase [Candidatus Woesearchaeota archaeon]|nr:dihydrofolate reductase [Candidatus Woesearchaeota archaeon]
MRKLILFIASSLDGYIAGKNGDISWLFTDQDYGYGKFFASIGTLIMGKKTFEVSLTFGGWPYPGKKCYVFTRNKHKNDSRVDFANNPVRLTKELLKGHGKDIWLVGGSKIISILLNAGLIHEIRLYVHPIILGSGIPLFKNIDKKINMKLIKIKTYSSGLVQLHYKII